MRDFLSGWRSTTEDSPVVGILVPVMIFIVGLIMVMSFLQFRHESELLASGECENIGRELYQPPPSMICTIRDSKGNCTFFMPIQADPYYRIMWECPDAGQKVRFWRPED